MSDLKQKGEVQIVGVQLTDDERIRMRRALADAQVSINEEEHWDSLDIVCALTVVEYELGITLDGTKIRTGDLQDIEGFEKAIAEYGVYSQLSARLRLDVSNLPDSSLDKKARSKSRRQMEYRLNLAMPQARVAVSRGQELAVYTCVDDVTKLPIQMEIAEAIGLAVQPQESNQRSPHAPNQIMPTLGADLPRGGAAGALADRLEQAILDFVFKWGGESWGPTNPVISVDKLRELGYYDAHPEQVMLLSPETALLPATCLNSYDLLNSSEDKVVLGTFSGSVFRRELYYNAFAGRLPAFKMREILWCADSEWERQFTEEVEKFVVTLAADLGIYGEWGNANDPFFLGGCENGRKREFRVNTQYGELAICSINRHEDHFVSRGYGREGRVTGCVGFGFERWIAVAIEK